MARITMKNLPDLARFQRRSHADSTFLAAVSRADCTRFALRSRVDLVEAVAALLGFEYFT